jgi:hypothetical protein
MVDNHDNMASSTGMLPFEFKSSGRRVRGGRRLCSHRRKESHATVGRPPAGALSHRAVVVRPAREPIAPAAQHRRREKAERYLEGRPRCAVCRGCSLCQPDAASLRHRRARDDHGHAALCVGGVQVCARLYYARRRSLTPQSHPRRDPRVGRSDDATQQRALLLPRRNMAPRSADRGAASGQGMGSPSAAQDTWAAVAIATLRH